MLNAVLFDLDGTLLDIELDSFLSAYFAALGPVMAQLLEIANPREALEHVIAGTNAMAAPHPGRTNRQTFDETIERLTGLKMADPSVARTIERFYLETFPSLGHDCAPAQGATEVVEAARRLGLRTALATNPIFPRVAIVERLRWAGLHPTMFDLVTTYENAPACKPSHDYYAWIAQSLGVAPETCLMVGDDAVLDMAAAGVGMETFLVGGRTDHWSPRCGDLRDVIGLLDASVLT